MIYGVFYSANRLCNMKTLRMALERRKIYNVILENDSDTYEALCLLTGTGACIDRNR